MCRQAAALEYPCTMQATHARAVPPHRSACTNLEYAYGYIQWRCAPVGDVFALLGGRDDARRARRRGRPAARARCCPRRTQPPTPRQERAPRAPARRRRAAPPPAASTAVRARRDRPATGAAKRPPSGAPRASVGLRPRPRLPSVDTGGAAPPPSPRAPWGAGRAGASVSGAASRSLGFSISRLEVERRLGHASLGVPPPQPQLHARVAHRNHGGGTSGAAASASARCRRRRCRRRRCRQRQRCRRVVLERMAARRRRARVGWRRAHHVQLQAGLGAHVVCREQPQLDEPAGSAGGLADSRPPPPPPPPPPAPLAAARARVGAAPAAIDEHVAAAAGFAAAALVAGHTTHRIPERVRRRRLHACVVELKPLLGRPAASGRLASRGGSRSSAV